MAVNAGLGKILAGCGLLLLFSSPSWPASPGESPRIPATEAAREAAPGPSPIEARYRAILAAVQEGRLPLSAGKEAIALRAALRHFLVDHEARVADLQLDLAAAAGPAREETVQQLVQAGADKERTLMKYRQRFERLPAGAGNGAGEDRETPGADEPGEAQRLRIEFQAEDLTKTKME